MKTREIRVVLVEDNSGLRNSLERLFSAVDGIALVGMFNDGESAVSGLSETSPDVVMVDLNLPGISGVEVIRKLKASMPDVQFMVLTVY
ncbi:MAG: response regulator transcription factor, partial [Lentisphaerae bacterium]|nr:response regulator transcription factor [Lentisphaerota bacterium]